MVSRFEIVVAGGGTNLHHLKDFVIKEADAELSSFDKLLDERSSAVTKRLLYSSLQRFACMRDGYPHRRAFGRWFDHHGQRDVLKAHIVWTGDLKSVGRRNLGVSKHLLGRRLVHGHGRREQS